MWDPRRRPPFDGVVHRLEGLGSPLQKVLDAVESLHGAAWRDKDPCGDSCVTPERRPSFWCPALVTFHDVDGHQAHHAGQERVAGRVHGDGPSHAVTNENDGGRSLTVARLDHTCNVADGSRADSEVDGSCECVVGAREEPIDP